MASTVHVVPKGAQWLVKSEGGRSARTFSTQKEAITSAKVLVKEQSTGQLVVYGRNGQIREHATYGMPPIQMPPGKRSAKIKKAVEKITREHLGMSDPHLRRG
jgi:hypothetical protein